MSTLKHLVDRVTRELQDATTRRLREYLLGGLLPKQRTEIERRLIDDEAFFQELLTAEDALVQDYIRRRLPSDMATRFAGLVASLPEWAQKVQFAVATKSLVERNTHPSSSRGAAALVDATYEELERLARRTLLRGHEQELEP